MSEIELIKTLIDKLVRYPDSLSPRDRIDILADIADNCLRDVYNYAFNYPNELERHLALKEYESLAEWFDAYYKERYLINQTTREEQEAILEWMRTTLKDTGDPIEVISDMFLETEPDCALLSCLSKAYQSLSKKEKLVTVAKFINESLLQIKEDGE